jgi:hypothetical protein
VIDPDLRDLPGLRQWGDELRAATSRAEEQRARPGIRRRRLPVRRLGVALAAMFLLVPGAVATRSIWDNPVERVAPLAPQPSSPAVRLVEGRTGDLQWRVGGYDGDGAERCLQIDAVAGGSQTRASCSLPQTPAQLTALSAERAHVGFVLGTTSPDVSAVEVVVPGGRRVRVTTTAISADVRRRSGMHGDFRVYVAPFPGGVDPVGPPQVTAFASDGRALGSVGPR